jgi:hypothetical protein
MKWTVVRTKQTMQSGNQRIFIKDALKMCKDLPPCPVVVHGGPEAPLKRL